MSKGVDDMKNSGDSKIDLSRKKQYDPYYENVLIKEEPFYKEGLTCLEIQEEVKYLNENLEAFYNGGYKPLWKQKKSGR